jgi:hypothetical protein
MQWRTWQALCAMGVTLILGFALGSSINGQAETTSSNAAQESTAVTLPETIPSTTEPPAPTTTTTAGPQTEFAGTGVFRVGVDIVPGTYRTEGPAIGVSHCYWERESAFGDSDGIIANDNIEGPGVVTIKSTDVGFKTSHCQRWVVA